MEKPILILYKKASDLKNQLAIPKKFTEKYGKEFYMEIYADKIILKPLKKGE